MKLSRRSRSVDSATNTCNLSARPRTIKGFGADMSNVIGAFDDPYDVVDDDNRFDSPEYDDPDIRNWSELVEIDFEDVAITILPDTTWDYKDKEYSWAMSTDSNDGDWYGDSNVFLGSPVDMVEHVDDLIVSQLPSTPGDYLISGHAALCTDSLLSFLLRSAARSHPAS